MSALIVAGRSTPRAGGRSSSRTKWRWTPSQLNLEGGSFFLTARLDVSAPGVDREVAQELIQAAHGICPYSKD